ncbi:MAG: glycosyltransferase family 4 protein [Anaerolineae bacterium]|nr:glycosyltransferase family 4 protein [Anaerolineae bacterium]
MSSSQRDWEPVHLIAEGIGPHSGISRYAGELYRRLQQQADVRLCSFRPPPLAGRFTFLEHLPLGVAPDSGRGVYHFTRIMGCALMLWRPVRPAVATVHDLGPLVWPPEAAKSPLLDRALFRLSLEGLKRMDRLIAVSEATAQSMEEQLAIPRARIDVVPEGVDPDRFQRVPQDGTLLAERYGLPDWPDGSTLLHVGGEAPRKNLAVLLQALTLLKRDGLPARLVKVGGSQLDHHRQFVADIVRLGLEADVVLVGPVPDNDLPLFYSAADVLLLPSYVEGFGLPVLEAMACGTPVVCSTAGSLPEVAGDAALLVPPDDAAGLADAIATVLQQADVRQRLAEKGLARCRQFSWQRTAAETMAVYQKLPGVV